MITTRRWGEPVPNDGITFEQLRSHGWAPGKYCAPCRTCRETHWDCDKRARSCRPCAVKALKAERAKPPAPAPAQTGPEPTDAQVAAFGEAFYGNLTQWGYSERQRNGLAEDVRRGLRAALALGAGQSTPGAVLEAAIAWREAWHARLSWVCVDIEDEEEMQRSLGVAEEALRVTIMAELSR